jgi:coenzyme F420-reducing hydrogenase delta subunit
MKAFEKGADGVYVAGCLEGDCHFKNGNIKAAHRVSYIKKLLDEIGVESERLEIVLMSAGMGEFFAETATRFTEKIRELGPSPILSGAHPKALAVAG